MYGRKAIRLAAAISSTIAVGASAGATASPLEFSVAGSTGPELESEPVPAAPVVVVVVVVAFGVAAVVVVVVLVVVRLAAPVCAVSDNAAALLARCLAAVTT